MGLYVNEFTTELIEEGLQPHETHAAILKKNRDRFVLLTVCW
jgi:hypothetical protein